MPVVGVLPQPFDQLGVVWTNRDITAQEVKALNDYCFEGPLKLLVKEGKEKKNSVLAAGVHFQVAALEQGEARLILDHLVPHKPPKARGDKTEGQPAQGGVEGSGTKTEEGSSSKTDKPETEKKEEGSGTKTDKPETEKKDDAGKPGTSVAPMAKALGPLSVRNIGLSVPDNAPGSVRISLDASAHFGPVSFDLVGLTFTVDLSGIKQLKDFAQLKPHVSIDGLGLAFEKPPVRLAGSFVRFERGGVSGFAGGISVSMAQWSALALGLYEEVADVAKAQDGKPALAADPFKSLFVFGVVQGLIAEFGCAEIDGVAGGFGYNSHLVLPDVEGVPDFQFIKMNGGDPPKETMVEQLAVFDGSDTTAPAIISAAKDEMWFVAGESLPRPCPPLPLTDRVPPDRRRPPDQGVPARGHPGARGADAVGRAQVRHPRRGHGRVPAGRQARGLGGQARGLGGQAEARLRSARHRHRGRRRPTARHGARGGRADAALLRAQRVVPPDGRLRAGLLPARLGPRRRLGLQRRRLPPALQAAGPLPDGARRPRGHLVAVRRPPAHRRRGLLRHLPAGRHGRGAHGRRAGSRLGARRLQRLRRLLHALPPLLLRGRGGHRPVRQREPRLRPVHHQPGPARVLGRPGAARAAHPRRGPRPPLALEHRRVLRARRQRGAAGAGAGRVPPHGPQRARRRRQGRRRGADPRAVRDAGRRVARAAGERKRGAGPGRGAHPGARRPPDIRDHLARAGARGPPRISRRTAVQGDGRQGAEGAHDLQPADAGGETVAEVAARGLLAALRRQGEPGGGQAGGRPGGRPGETERRSAV